jgi:AraC-like DNA-binding protein
MRPHPVVSPAAPRHQRVEARELLAWRELVGHVIDVVPSLAQARAPFQASLDRYRLSERLFTDCSSAAMQLDRSLARISTDDKRDFVFHVFLRGGLDAIDGVGTGRCPAAGSASLLVLDLDQPVRMHRSECRVLSLFVPRAAIYRLLPHADTLHGRVLENALPITRLLIEHIMALAEDLPQLDAEMAAQRFDVAVELLVAAFAKRARLGGNTRAAVRAAMFDRTRRFVRDNLHRHDLTPEQVLHTLQLPRPSLYRLFEHEGGLGSYIRTLRLREAASELVRFPHLAVGDIAYGLGFNSASDFSRAFRRTYAMAPQDLRSAALERERQLSTSSASSRTAAGKRSSP